MRPVVLQAVRTALKTSPYKLDAQKLSVRIIIELTPFVETGVEQQVQAVKEQNSGLIQTIVDRLRPAIINTVKGIEGNAISEDLMNEIVSVISLRMKGLIKQRVDALMKTDSSLPDNVLADRVLASMQQDIIGAIVRDPKYRAVEGKKGFGLLMQKILDVLRPIVLQEIQLWRSANTVKVEKPAPPVQSSGSLTSVFGVSGQNFVKVDTPAFNYGYETR